jgi:MoxR-like ATPase
MSGVMQLFKGTGTTAPKVPVDLPPVDRSSLNDPRFYDADPALVQAVNVALWLRAPLVVTGEPGTGKTQLAARIAFELGLGKPLKFETKSTSVAQDLLYSFDTVGRFGAAQLLKGSEERKEAEAEVLAPQRYVRYQALGLAILLANSKEQVENWMPPGFKDFGPRRSVVLIDEVDKAPRDFPNDLLTELDQMSFRVPEISADEITAPDNLRPIVVITSNSEKQLPDAFLRRCVFFHIELKPEQLERIVAMRLPRVRREAVLVKDAIQCFLRLREDTVYLNKKPSTAELLNWIDAMLSAGALDGVSLTEQRQIALNCVGTLAKFRDDVPAVRAVIESWGAPR